ncbi:MAG TPA: preprotein translocase subunit SecE [Armatimonadota bacterium]|nr:preprotein translocase subunit SecE [Armatimonadota bacterium]
MAVHKDDAVNMTAAQAGEKSTTNAPGPVKRYLREVTAELKKTNWPTKDELTKSVMVVIVTIIVVAIFLYLCDVVAAHVMSFVGIVPSGAGR